MSDIDALERHLLGYGRVLLGYSGGVDSALVAVAARRVLGPASLLAVIGRSASYPEVQRQAAVGLARRHDIPLLEVDTGELADARYLANPTNRCYFCKTELWTRLGQVARERGFPVIVDGTNADDLGEHRPGLRAAEEHAIRSPLAELGWGKARVRDVSRDLGLATWDAPAAPCLSSRVAYGLQITPGRLQQVERAEAVLRGLGVVGDLRVRHHGDRARIEVVPDQLDRVRAAWPIVEAELGVLGFGQVELDPAGYRRGGLLPLAAAPA
jgi:pyridinium-3,5-biscarboxylic acid mononucleotide sulfurtransferase